MLVPTFIAQAEKPAPSLTGTTTYDFVGHLGTFDADGRLLVWKGTVSGDNINGVMLWWFDMPTKEVGQTTHFVGRWEIWTSDPPILGGTGSLLLAGDEAGTTTVRHGKNSIWRANGTVTEASLEFFEWIGRNIHDGGDVDWGAPPEIFPSGSGEFRIN